MSPTSGFVDSVIFAYNGPYGGMSIPLRRVTSLYRQAQANAPAASYWLRGVLDDVGRRYYTDERIVQGWLAAGGEACSIPSPRC